MLWKILKLCVSFDIVYHGHVDPGHVEEQFCIIYAFFTEIQIN